jgi:ferrous-iron efflux pump FieF
MQIRVAAWHRGTDGMGSTMEDTRPIAMQNSNDTARHARLLHLATHASVATATLLIAAKLAAWVLTGSVSVLASLIDSMMDVAASLVNLFAVRYALMPADREHRFGHGKAESLAGLAQTTFIAGSAVFLMLQALDRLLHPRPLEDVGIGVGVMVFATLATLALLLLQRHVIRATGSTAIRADALHYTTDVLTNASIIIALLLSSYGWHGIDALFGLGIAVYILYSAWTIGHEAFQLLMDRELPDEQRRRIRQAALTHAQVRGVHDLRTRRSGHDIFIQLHLELDDELSLFHAHKIADQVEELIRNIHPEADILIHTDPRSLVENVAFR